MRKPPPFRSVLPMALALLAHFAPIAIAQERPATNVDELVRLAERFRDELEAGRTPLYYDLLGRTTGPQGALNGTEGIELMYLREGRFPVFYETQNINAARTLSTDDVWPGGSGGLFLTGSTTALGDLSIWDGGAVRTSHNEFGGRASQEDGASTTSYHATHVAGTMIAAGVQSNARGMSYQAELACYDWNSDESEMASAAAAGMEVSNHSYGYITGWYWNGSDWYWYGDVDVSTVEDYGFGFYEDVTRAWDEIAHNAPYYTIVASAGNDRDDDGPGPGGGHYFWDPGTGGWEWSTATRNPDGGTNGYDCISWNKTAKNILSIGAVDDITGGWSQPSDVDVAYFSGWGPTDDGRIKPDFVANGISLYSTDDDNNSDYATFSGTSMASPNASGSINLLVRHYETTHGETPLASTMKAVLMQTASEAGPDDGPDYMHGWGLVHTLHGAELIAADEGTTGLIREEILADGEIHEYSITVGAGEEIRLSVAWTDPPGTPPAPAVDPADIMLVNDLDLRAESPAEAIYSPWILSPASPSSAATKGDNIRDNCEQIVQTAPSAGVYRVTVSHKGTLSSPQAYSIASSHDLTSGAPPSPPAWYDASAGLPQGNGDTRASAWADFDDDGDQDLYVVRGPGENALLVNAGGQFTDGTPAELLESGEGRSAVWADFDNDARVDLFLANDGTNRLFHNDGGGSFTDVVVPPMDDPATTVSGTWVDFDNDRKVDLFFIDDGTPTLLLRNAGVGPFVDATLPPLDYTSEPGAAAWGDFDSDGDADLYRVSRSPGDGRLLRNEGFGFFTDVTSGPLANFGVGVTALWDDFDNDLDLDLFLLNEGAGTGLFLNDGGASFSAAPWNPTLAGTARTAASGDVDFDGDLDLFIGTEMGVQLFRNDGSGAFVDATEPFLLDVTDDVRSVTLADVDADGDLDLFAGVIGQDRLFRNDVDSGNRWIHLLLVGTASNRSAIGARARVVASGMVQIREVSGGGQSSLPLEFGLGAATQVDTVEIAWPSGFTQTVTGLAAPGFHLIVEDELSTDVVAADGAAPGAFRLLPNMPNPFNPLTAIRFEIPAEARVRVAVFDVTGRRVALLADGLRPAGRFDVIWDGRDEGGRPVPSGAYFARMEGPDFTGTRKMMLVR